MYNMIEYSLNCSYKTSSLPFYSNADATNFGNDIVNTGDFRFFKCEAKINLSNIKLHYWEIQLHNVIQIKLMEFQCIFQNFCCNTNSVASKDLSNFWRSLEMSLINCRVELKLERTKYCVLSAGGNDNVEINLDNIIFTIKGTKFYGPVGTLSAKDK